MPSIHCVWKAVPPVGEDGHPPALHLAEACVREFDVQGQLGDPDCHFQGGTEDVIAEGDPGIHGPARLLSAHKHVVAAAGYLGRGKEVGWHGLPYRASCGLKERSGGGGGGTRFISPGRCQLWVSLFPLFLHRSSLSASMGGVSSLARSHHAPDYRRLFLMGQTTPQRSLQAEGPLGWCSGRGVFWWHPPQYRGACPEPMIPPRPIWPCGSRKISSWFISGAGTVLARGGGGDGERKN